MVSLENFQLPQGGQTGDPLSPLLFAIAADLLQSITNDAWNKGILKYPISESFGGDLPIMQYADDTLLILPAKARTLFYSKVHPEVLLRL